MKLENYYTKSATVVNSIAIILFCTTAYVSAFAQEYQTVESNDSITAQTVLRNYVEAIGGVDKINEIKTLKKVQKFSASVVTNMGGKETMSASNFVYEITHLEPSKYLLQTEYEGIPKAPYQVMIDDKLYSNFQSTGWTESNNEAGKELVGTVGSYVPEHSLLLRNLDVTYLGVETIEGTKCHKLRLPDLEQINDYGMTISTQKYVRHNYYDVDTGLLYISEWENTLQMEPKGKPSAATETLFSNQTIHFDYRPVNGVLFSFKNNINSFNKSKAMESFTEQEMEMTEILLNTDIDESLFDVSND